MDQDKIKEIYNFVDKYLRLKEELKKFDLKDLKNLPQNYREFIQIEEELKNQNLTGLEASEIIYRLYNQKIQEIRENARINSKEEFETKYSKLVEEIDKFNSSLKIKSKELMNELEKIINSHTED